MKKLLGSSMTLRIILLSREPWRETLTFLIRLWYSWITEPCRMYAHRIIKPVPGEGGLCDLCVHRGGWLMCSYSRTTPDPMADIKG